MCYTHAEKENDAKFINNQNTQALLLHERYVSDGVVVIFMEMMQFTFYGTHIVMIQLAGIISLVDMHV